MTNLDMRTSLIEQMSFAWNHMFVPRMEGLTNHEYLWAPVADTWTVYPGTEGGPPTIDPQIHADPAPFTTIAWRMHHMTDFFTKRRVNHFGDPESEEMNAPVSLSVSEGMANLAHAYGRWEGALMSMPDERLHTPCGPAEHHFSEAPFADLILHINREFIHHAAECALIRDLYRQKDSLR